MPSIRELCSKFQCAKATVVRAYYELRQQDVIYAVPGSGYYLIDDGSQDIEQTNVIDFSGTQLDASSLPDQEFRSCLKQAITKNQDAFLCYTEPQGLGSLREVLVKQLENNQVFTSKERLFVTTGSQQAIDILSRMPFPNGKSTVVIEQPTYRGMVQSLRLNDINTIGVARDFSGLDFDRLENVFRNSDVKFFYTVSRFSNPLGLSYSTDEKRRLLALAEKYDVYIVEDDYLGDLDANSRSDPIFAYDIADRVVYLKTFSKLLMPGLRVGVAVLPGLLMNLFAEYKSWADINTPAISQGALEVFLRSGMYDVHIKRVRSLYVKRMEYLKKIAEDAHSPSIKWYIQPGGGFYAGLRILNNRRANGVSRNLLGKNIILSDTEPHFLKEFFDDKLLRVSVANADIEAIKAGVPILIDEIDNQRRSFQPGRKVDL